ncbi:MAG: hypothetical protein JWO98_4794 [Frankiales bacterium]|nr:hypothetical protein [Frankiales bacterium]
MTRRAAPPDLGKRGRAFWTSTKTTGQPRVHPAVGELRQHRLALGRLLSQLALPDEALPTPLQARAGPPPRSDGPDTSSGAPMSRRSTLSQLRRILYLTQRDIGESSAGTSPARCSGCRSGFRSWELLGCSVRLGSSGAELGLSGPDEHCGVPGVEARLAKRIERVGILIGPTVSAYVVTKLRQ